MNAQASPPAEKWPGERLGLAESGPGALASWGQRIAALLLDWAICTLIALLLFGGSVMTGQGWERFAVLIVFFVETSVFCFFTGASLVQLITGIGVIRLDGQRLGWRAFMRALLVSLALPALIIGADRRGLQDIACNTVVIRRR